MGMLKEVFYRGVINDKVCADFVLEDETGANAPLIDHEDGSVTLDESAAEAGLSYGAAIPPKDEKPDPSDA